MNFTCIFFGIVFLAAGIVFFAGKVHIHLSAWKAMPEQEKAKIRIKPLCRNIGTVISLCGLLFLTGGVWSSFKDHVFVWAMMAWLLLAGIDVYYIDKSNRYMQK